MDENNRFEKKRLDGAVFRDCSLAGATFDDVNLARATFANVSLQGCAFRDANLSGATIDDARIDGLKIFGHDIQALIRAELRRAKPIPASARPVTFLVTRDRAAAKRFYGETLGFLQTHEDDFAVVFDLNGTALRISTVKDHAPAAHTVLGWSVPDIVASVTALKAKGIAFTVYEGFGQDELGIWTAPGSGTRVAWFLDPDGNNLSLTQA